MISADRFVGQYDVHKVHYDDAPLYNILMDKHTTVRANKLVCETLDPSCIVAQLYANQLLTAQSIVSINKTIIQTHKQNKKNKFKSILYKL